MKFNKLKISHYLIFFVYSINIFLSLFFIIITNSKSKKRITLYGHKLEGNLHYFFKNQNYFEHEIIYISFSLKEYKSLSLYSSNIFYALNLIHVFKTLQASVMIASHGIFYHKLIKQITNIKTFNIGHGISNVLNKVNPKIPDQIFDSHWVMSQFEKEVIENDNNIVFKNLEVTGFLRINNLIENKDQGTHLKEKTGLSNKICLYAPSGVQKYDKENPNNFQYRNIEFLKLLNTLSNSNDITTIFKPHHQNYEFKEIENEVMSFINKSSNIIYFKDLDLEDLNELMLVSDFLITDYSSLFVDYLILDRPIIFLEVKKVMDQYAYSDYFNNEFIHFINTFEELKSNFLSLIDNETNLAKLKSLKNLIYKDNSQNNVLNLYKLSISNSLNINKKDV